MSTQGMDTVTFVKAFASGGIAGMVAKTAIAPLDRIKILLQGHNSHYQSFGVMSGLVKVVQKEGFLGLYKGNGAMMIRAFPFASIQFVSFDMYKKNLSPFFQSDSHLFKLFAGSLAGVNAVIMTYPLDLVRARLAFMVKPKGGSSPAGSQSQGVASTIKFIYQNEGGIRGLYRGLTPTLCHIIPYAGLNFYFFERVKGSMLTTYSDVFAERKGDQLVLSVPAKLICGGVGGSIAQTIAYPLDVARRRMQLSFTSEETRAKYSKGVVSVLVTTYKEYGVVRGLFRGMTANYLRVAPMMSVNFAAFEMLKQLFGLKTGIDIKSG